jgi:periplasmic divalent cation tolerance protein
MSDSPAADSVQVVFISIPREDAGAMAKRLVENRLAACVSVTPKIESYYRWQGEIKQDEEAMLICKTTATKLGELSEFVRDNHPYDVPEIIAVSVANGLPEYIAWVRSETEG